MRENKVKLAILALTRGGKELAERLAKTLAAQNINLADRGIARTTQEIWHQYDGLIFIMATGIVVRTIAPLLADKKTDPAVVVLDEAGKYAISLLAGHLGGANKLAKEIAANTGGEAVISTASDVLGLTPVDLWARHNNLLLIRGSFTTISARLVNSGRLRVWSDIDGLLPADFKRTANQAEADLFISNRLHPGQTAQLCPQNIIIGLGCNRGAKAAEFKESLAEIGRINNLAPEAVTAAASIDLKSDEAGLLEFCDGQDLPITFYTADQLNTISTSRSEVVFKATGAYGVCEPAALLRAAAERYDHDRMRSYNDNYPPNLLCGKTKWKNVTIALAEIRTQLTANYQ